MFQWTRPRQKIDRKHINCICQKYEHDIYRENSK